MKVGDYVRTEDDLGVQLICKIKARFNDFCNTDEGYWDDNHIIKSSPNIIDLIEVGDYVNGIQITSIENDNKGKYVFGYGADGMEGEMWFYNDNIKSIVTREQFSQIEYRIGE